VNRKKKQIMYTRALHTPTLSTNLILVSMFDRVGLTTTFRNGCGTVRCKEGRVVLTGKCKKGMYIVHEIGDSPNNPMAMISLSHPVPLEQWHCWLAHCSPLTIGEMEQGNLVDGLKIMGATYMESARTAYLGGKPGAPLMESLRRH
jgi:hypothetical protein